MSETTTPAPAVSPVLDEDAVVAVPVRTPEPGTTPAPAAFDDASSSSSDGEGGDEDGVAAAAAATAALTDDDDEAVAAALLDGNSQEAAAEHDVRRRIRERRRTLSQLCSQESAAAAPAEEEDEESAETLRRQRGERFNFLLRQIENATSTAGASSPSKQQQQKQQKQQQQQQRGRRSARRRLSTEGVEGEDEAEFARELAQEGVVRHYEASPAFVRGGSMKPYQVAALNWLIRRHDAGISGVLADEMGLGKTLESISILGYLHQVRGVAGPHLVIAPKSTLPNWMRELGKWAPYMRCTKLHGNKDERAAIVDDVVRPGRFDVIVTSYEVSIIEKAALSKHHWKYIVIDEAHRIKNEKSLLSRVVRRFRSEHRLLITGTPLQNNLHELWALLNFLLPEVFSSSDDFDEWFALESSDATRQKETVERLHRVLQPFLLRRLKSEVEHALPPKKEIKLFVGMSAMQNEWYRKVLLRDVSLVNGSGSGGGHKMQLLNTIMQLRKVCNHPYLFDGAEQGPLDGTTGEDIVANCGKMIVLDKLLPKLHDQGSRVLIFCQMTRMMDILEDYLNLREFTYCRVDGSTTGDERDQQIEYFNRPGSDAFVFLLSTRAGGLGINLATADTVVLYDSDWNPQVDLQAQDRAHRIGQTRPVNVYRFVTEGTIEMKIVQRAERKLHLDAIVIQQGRLTAQQRGADADELLSMIRFGADEIFKTTGGTIDDAEIDIILRRGEERTVALSQKLGEKLQRQAFNLQNFSSVDAQTELDTFSWDGKNWREVRDTGKINIPVSAYDLPKRDRPVTLSEGVLLAGSSAAVAAAAAAAQARKLPRPPKQHIIHDFQFYPQRLTALLEKERAAYISRRTDAETNAPEKTPLEYGDLTSEEEEEKARLLQEGFSTWNRREYQAFVRGCEKHGRTAYEGIQREIGDSKTLEQVKSYGEVFWRRWRELRDGERAVKAVERGEERLRRDDRLASALQKKIEQYKDPWRQLRVVFRGQGTQVQFTDVEDALLVNSMHEAGIGNWEAVRERVLAHPALRFDWFMRSRTVADIARRCETLLRVIEREVVPEAAAAPKRKKPTPSAPTPDTGNSVAPKRPKPSLPSVVISS